MNWRPDVLFDLRTSAGFIHKRGWVSEGDELFAVHPQHYADADYSPNWWTLTHVPTGHRIRTGFADAAEAKAFAEELLVGAPVEQWLDLKTEEIPEDLKVAYHAAVKKTGAGVDQTPTPDADRGMGPEQRPTPNKV